MHLTTRPLCLIIALALPLNSTAAISTSLMDGMLISATGPSVYQSQSRMGLVGGTLALRVPNQSISVTSFDMPRLEAGCGGIDMFGGSFSFINAEKLIAVFRNIGQIAVASLFKLAINAISKELGLNMSEFSEAMQKLNNIKMNTCKIGTELATSAWDAAGLPRTDKARQHDESIATQMGEVGESLKNWWNGLFADPESKKIKPRPENALAGNSTYRALIRSNAWERVANANLFGNSIIDLVMNIGGAHIIPTNATTTIESCPSYSILDGLGTSQCTRKEVTIEPLLTMEALMNPGEKAIMVCDFSEGPPAGNEFACTRSKGAKLKDVFPGARVRAYQILFGRTGGECHAKDDPEDTCSIDGGVVNYITTGSWGTFDATRHMGSAAPLMRHLVSVQRDPEATRQIALAFAEVIANDIAVAMADALTDVARHAFNGVQDVSKPPKYDENVASFKSNIAEYRQNAAAQIEKQKALIEYTAKVSASLGSGDIGMPGAFGSKGGR